MSLIWTFELNKKLENVLRNLKETGPKDLREIAEMIGISPLNDNTDRSALKYRINRVKSEHEDLKYVGYDGRGYIYPVYVSDFYRIYVLNKNRGDGFARLANKYKEGARNADQGQPKSIQTNWFIELFGE